MKIIRVSYASTLLFICVCLLSKVAQSQLVNNGGAITITSGAVIFTTGSFINTSTGTVDNDGEIVTGTDLINDTNAILSGNGVYRVQVNFTNNGTYNQDSSTLNFYGTGNSNIKNVSGNIYMLLLNKDSGYIVNLLDNERVVKSVNFLMDNNWVKLNNRTLTLAPACKIENFGNKRFFITNGSGKLKKMNVKNTPFIFPVGFDKQTYNRVTITEKGTADAYTVRCRGNALLNGNAGAAISNGGIKAGWVINENTAGGANAVIEVEWKNPADELPGFDYTKCRLVRYGNNGWDYVLNQAGTATGTTYRAISRSGLSNFGEFTVLSKANPTFTEMHFAEVNSISSDVAGKTELRVYPTMVQNNFNIQVPDGYKQTKKMNITILDAGGIIVWKKPNADFTSQRVTLPDLTSGIYMVLINYDNKRFVEKIMISR